MTEQRIFERKVEKKLKDEKRSPKCLGKLRVAN